MKERIKLWALALVIAFVLAQYGGIQNTPEVELETINVNVPVAMQSAFEQTLVDTELNQRYRINFTNKQANFTVTTYKSDNNEVIAYSPIVAVFNEDEELYQNYIEKGIFVPSDIEPEEYDFDFQKIMKDIIENPNSEYKVYYPDSSVCDWNVFYAFLLYSANDGCYPSDGTNMEETQAKVDVFLQSKNTQAISREFLNKVQGFAKNSIYFIPLADVGYIYETEKVSCRVMYPKTVVYCHYYASFDEIGKILFDSLGQETGTGFFGTYKEYVGYYNLKEYGNYFVRHYPASVTISRITNGYSYYLPGLRENFNAVEVPRGTG